jgi:hypothetical protein
MHDDSFAHSTIDEGIYDQPMDWFFWSRVQSAGGTDFWTYGAMGGEVRPELQETIFNENYMNGTQYKQDFGMCSEITHATYMLNYYAAWPGYSQGYALDKARAASDRMGYAFRVMEVSAAEGTVADTVDITTTVVQDGIAPFYYDLGIELSCAGYSNTVGGVDGIVSEGSSASFTFTGVPATSACLSAVAFSLSSSYALPGIPVKFAQGISDGSTVEVSLPLPGPTSSGFCSDGTGGCTIGDASTCECYAPPGGGRKLSLKGSRAKHESFPDNSQRRKRRLAKNPKPPKTPAPNPPPMTSSPTKAPTPEVKNYESLYS